MAPARTVWKARDAAAQTDVRGVSLTSRIAASEHRPQSLVCKSEPAANHAMSATAKATFGSQSRASRWNAARILKVGAVHAEGEDERPERRGGSAAAPGARCGATRRSRSSGGTRRSPWPRRARRCPRGTAASRSMRGETARRASRLDPASTVIATAPAAIHAGGSASVGLERLERPPQEHHGHHDEVEHEAKRERGQARRRPEGRPGRGPGAARRARRWTRWRR